MARSIGMFVNKDTTSKETKVSLGVRLSEVVKAEKSLEFRTAEGDWPTRGERRYERCLDRL